MPTRTQAPAQQSGGLARCPQCGQSVPVRNWCRLSHHTYTVNGHNVQCPGTNGIQAVVSSPQAPAGAGDMDPPGKRTCNSCSGTGKVKSGRDRNDNVIWVKCHSCDGTGEI